MPKKLSITDFVIRCNKVHSNKYDYSESEYINKETKLKIICKIHGSFWQIPNNHWKGQGCPDCGGSRRLTFEEFKNKAQQIHGKKYKYIVCDYKNQRSIMKIICPIHGIFHQRAGVHNSGAGCQKCANRIDGKMFIEKSHAVHGNEYDYSKIQFKGIENPVTIKCNKHGNFELLAKNHLKGRKCNYCEIQQKFQINDKDLKKCVKEEEFIKKCFIYKATGIHKNFYDYANVELTKKSDLLEIICPMHGLFRQTASNHLEGSGCSECGKLKRWDNRERPGMEEFIKEGNLIHKNKYDYSQVKYKDSKTKVRVICPKHGPFWINRNKHISSAHGCTKCGIDKSSKAQGLGLDEFLKRAKEKHGDKFSYNFITKYISGKQKVKFVCVNHGEFWTSFAGHIRASGGGCPLCRYIISGVNQRITFKEFVKRSNEIHGGWFEYDPSTYKQTANKTKIICPEHGEFHQTPPNHLKSTKPCPKCRGIFVTDFESFLNKAREIHGDEYEYIESSYTSSQGKISFTCKKHGLQNIWLQGHISGGKGCPECSLERRTINQTKTFDDFLLDAMRVHKSKYEYVESTYSSALKKMEIICEIHGSFLQSPDNHLHGKGCRKCKTSHGENYIKEILEENDIEFIFDWSDHDCIVKRPLKFDFFIPELNIIIEYDGIQHFEPSDFFGGEKAFKKLQKYDRLKNKWADKNGFKLVRVKYDQDIDRVIDDEVINC